MEQTSLTDQATSLHRTIGNILSSFDIDALPSEEKRLVALIKRQSADARLDVRDYEFADTRVEQRKLAKQARERLEQLQQHIVKASEYNIFNAIDVAQLSAHIQQVISQLV